MFLLWWKFDFSLCWNLTNTKFYKMRGVKHFIWSEFDFSKFTSAINLLAKGKKLLYKDTLKVLIALWINYHGLKENQIFLVATRKARYSSDQMGVCWPSWSLNSSSGIIYKNICICCLAQGSLYPPVWCIYIVVRNVELENVA